MRFVRSIPNALDKSIDQVFLGERRQEHVFALRLPLVGHVHSSALSEQQVLKPIPITAADAIHKGQDTTNEISMVLKGNKATLVINGNEGQRIHWPRAPRRELFRLPHLFSERRSRSLDCHPKEHSGSRGRGTIAHRIAGAPTTEADIATQFARYGGSPVLRPILVDHGPDRECCADCAAAQAHQCPALGMEVHGSLGGSAAPFCKSSIDCLSGERTNAIMPSRGGRLMVTPAFISISQVA